LERWLATDKSGRSPFSPPSSLIEAGADSRGPGHKAYNINVTAYPPQEIRAVCKYAVDWKAARSAQCALPDIRHAPFESEQPFADSTIPFDIGADLLSPEFFARTRPAEQVAAMAMPESAIGENHSTTRGEN
jgi:hypothetical protein